MIRSGGQTRTEQLGDLFGQILTFSSLICRSLYWRLQTRVSEP